MLSYREQIDFDNGGFFMSAKIKAFKEKYPHIWVVSYFIIYMIWFVWLESRASETFSETFSEAFSETFSDTGSILITPLIYKYIIS